MRRNFRVISSFSYWRKEQHSVWFSQLSVPTGISQSTVFQRTSFSLSHPEYHTCKLTQTLWLLASHGQSPRSGKAAFFFWDFIFLQSSLCPSLVFPLFVFFPVETFKQDQSWEDVRPMMARTKGVLWGTSSMKRMGGYSGDSGTTTDGECEIMQGWRTRLQKSCQSLLSFFPPSTFLWLFLSLWVTISISQNPPQMEWPFISQRAEIELKLLMGIISIDLHVSLLGSEGPPQTTPDRWRYNCSRGEAS